MGRCTSAVERYVTYLVSDAYWRYFMWTPLAGSLHAMRAVSKDTNGNHGRRFCFFECFTAAASCCVFYGMLHGTPERWLLSRFLELL